MDYPEADEVEARLFMELFVARAALASATKRITELEAEIKAFKERETHEDWLRGY